MWNITKLFYIEFRQSLSIPPMRVMKKGKLTAKLTQQNLLALGSAHAPIFDEGPTMLSNYYKLY